MKGALRDVYIVSCRNKPHHHYDHQDHHQQQQQQQEVFQREAYLLQCPFAVCQLVKHEDGDDEQGAAGHEPAKDVGPQRVDVAVAEFQRGVLDNGEDEGALARRSTRDRQVSELCFSGLLSLPLGKEDPSHI